MCHCSDVTVQSVHAAWDASLSARHGHKYTAVMMSALDVRMRLQTLLSYCLTIITVHPFHSSLTITARFVDLGYTQTDRHIVDLGNFHSIIKRIAAKNLESQHCMMDSWSQTP
jgi:hypothetical protein